MKTLRRGITIGLVLGLLAVPAAAQEPPDDGQYLVEGFETSYDEWSGDWLGSRISFRNNIEATAGVDGSAIRVTIPAGGHYGSELRWRFWQHDFDDPEQVWFRYYLKLEADGSLGRGKIPGVAGLYSSSGRGNVPPSSSRPGWSARLQFNGDPDEPELGYYLYHQDQQQRFGNGLPWVDGVRLGEWMCVEGHVAMNTPGEPDGVLVGWLDGAEAYRNEALRFRAASEGFVGVESFWLAVYHGGAEVAEVEHRFSIDELVVADHRVGCGSPTPWGFDDVTDPQQRAAVQRLESVGLLPACDAGGSRFCPRDRLDAETLASAAEVLAALGVEGLSVEPASIARDLLSRALAVGPSDLTRGEFALVVSEVLSGPVAPWEGEFDLVLAPDDDVVGAVAAAGPGARILFTPGRYRVESIEPLEGQELVGAPGTVFEGTSTSSVGIGSPLTADVSLSGITLLGYDTGVVAGAGWAIDHVDVVSNRTVGIAVLGSSTTLREVSGWGNGNVHVLVSNATNVVIEDSSFESANVRGDVDQGAVGIQAREAAGLRVDDVSVRDTNGVGMLLVSTPSVWISDAVLEGNSGGAIGTVDVLSLRLVDSTIAGNGVANDEVPATVSTDAGILFVTRNRFEGNDGGFVHAPVSGAPIAWVTRNQFIDTGASGRRTGPADGGPFARWEWNEYRGVSATSFVGPEGLLSRDEWMALGSDGRSTFFIG